MKHQGRVLTMPKFCFDYMCKHTYLYINICVWIYICIWISCLISQLAKRAVLLTTHGATVDESTGSHKEHAEDCKATAKQRSWANERCESIHAVILSCTACGWQGCCKTRHDGIPHVMMPTMLLVQSQKQPRTNSPMTIDSKIITFPMYHFWPWWTALWLLLKFFSI